MKHCIYIGPLEHLKDKTAIIWSCSEEGFVFAQFDDTKLTLDGRPLPPIDHHTRIVIEYEPHARFPTEVKEQLRPPLIALGFGSHKFPSNCFKEIEDDQTIRW